MKDGSQDTEVPKDECLYCLQDSIQGVGLGVRRVLSRLKADLEISLLEEQGCGNFASHLQSNT